MIAAVCVVAALAGGWFLVLAPKRSEASKLQSQITAAQSELSSVEAQVTQGEAAKATFSREYAALARLGEAVPQDDDVPSLMYQIQTAASKTGVDFRTLSLTSSGTSAATAPTPGPGGVAAPQLPPGATVGPAGFPTEPFTFTFQGNFFHLSDFFLRLQRFVVATNKRVAVSGRLMTLNAISFGPGGRGFPQISAQVSATTYLVPAGEGLTNGATPAGPSASSGAQTVASSQPSTTATPAVATAPVQ
jgi:hypothetical protein